MSLSNAWDDEDNPIIEWIQPCPSVKWASELNRDKGFLINLSSDIQDKLSVTVNNPDFNDRTFIKKRETGRLEHVFLKYRKMGKLAWLRAKRTPVEDRTDINKDFTDFAASYAVEDGYGYSTLTWNIENRLIPSGKYEIMVETSCTDLGGPSDVNGYRTEIIPGIIDRSRPQEYGQPLPLRDTVIAGEEMVVMFTEPLDCSLPLSFDIELRIEGMLNFDKDNIDVRCEGRGIGFQINLGQIDYKKLLGEDFEVEIGRIGEESLSNIYDSNGNSLELNVKFKRTFAAIDLSSASTSFKLLLEDFPCDAGTDIDVATDEITKEIVDLADLKDISRLSIDEFSCNSHGRRASAQVHISSARDQSLRRMLSGDAKIHATAIFKQITDVITSESARKDEERKLYMMSGNEEAAQKSIRYSVIDVKILPSESDIEKFKTHSDNEEEEHLLYHLALQTDLAEDTGEDLEELILDESRKERLEMKSEIKKLEKELANRESGLKNTLETLMADIADRENNLETLVRSNQGADHKFMFLCSCAFVALSAVLSIAAFIELKK